MVDTPSRHDCIAGNQDPVLRGLEDLIDEARMQGVPRAYGNDFADKRQAKKRHISHEIQNLVSHELIDETEPVHVEQALVRENKSILQRPAEAEARIPERLDFP